MINGLQAIILAAGKSSRFKTTTTKLIEQLCGQELVIYPIKLMHSMQIPVTAVVGHQKEHVQEIIEQQCGESITYVIQEEQHGTAHAIASTHDTWHRDHILIMHGDTPLVTQEIIEELYAQHIKTDAALSFVMAHNPDPSLVGYARVAKNGAHITVREAHMLDSDSNDHCCVNASIYIIKKSVLETLMADLELCEANKECSFAEIINLASSHNYPIATTVASFDRIRGINTFQELWAAQQIKKAELINYWMEHGVKFPWAQSVHLDVRVTIGAETTIGCGVHLLGTTTIGENCTVHEFSSLENSTIGDNSTVHSHTVIKNSLIGTHTEVGPFAHIREHAVIGNNAMIGNFVEIKKSSVGNNTKAKHLTYLGDAEVGSQVNIGAGTITCNHNGATKNKTVINDNAYVGANSILVAPVTVGAHAFTAAGSVITQDVPADALAIGRARQVNKEGYALKLRKQKSSSAFVAAMKTETNPTSAVE